MASPSRLPQPPVGPWAKHVFEWLRDSFSLVFDHLAAIFETLIDAIMDDWRIEPVHGGLGNRLILRKRVDAIACDEGSET